MWKYNPRLPHCLFHLPQSSLALGMIRFLYPFDIIGELEGIPKSSNLKSGRKKLRWGIQSCRTWSPFTVPCHPYLNTLCRKGVHELQKPCSCLFVVSPLALHHPWNRQWGSNRTCCSSGSALVVRCKSEELAGPWYNAILHLSSSTNGRYILCGMLSDGMQKVSLRARIRTDLHHPHEKLVYLARHRGQVELFLPSNHRAWFYNKSENMKYHVFLEGTQHQWKVGTWNNFGSL